MYFVAIGSGKTQFSQTYDQHLGAVNKYLKKPVEKPVKKKVHK
jgi:cell division protein YceG involved in septum cleavage